MKHYDSFEKTPMNFHKVVWFAALPLGILICCYQLASYDYSWIFSAPSWPYWVEICYIAAAMTLQLACFFGFFKRREYALHSLRMFLLLFSLYSLYALIMYFIFTDGMLAFGSEELIFLSARLAVALIYSAFVGMYYQKRAPLFLNK